MGALGVGIAVAGGLVAAAAAETAYFYRRTMIRQQAKMERTVKMAGTDWSQYTDFLTERKTFMMAQPHEDVYQTSFDGLKIHAAYFPRQKACGHMFPRIYECKLAGLYGADGLLFSEGLCHAASGCQSAWKQ